MKTTLDSGGFIIEIIQFVSTLAIAIVVAGGISFGGRQDVTQAVGHYLASEMALLFAAGIVALVPIVLYFVNKANHIHREMEETYDDMRDALIPPPDSLRSEEGGK